MGELALRELVEALDDEAGLTMSRRLAEAWSNARQALYTQGRPCPDVNCSMPNGHPGKHYDARDGAAW